MHTFKAKCINSSQSPSGSHLATFVVDNEVITIPSKDWLFDAGSEYSFSVDGKLRQVKSVAKPGAAPINKKAALCDLADCVVNSSRGLPNAQAVKLQGHAKRLKQLAQVNPPNKAAVCDVADCVTNVSKESGVPAVHAGKLQGYAKAIKQTVHK